MPRVQLDLPDSFPFSTEITVYYEHINLGKHLDNARLIGLIAEVRNRWLLSLGYPENAIEGLITTVADLVWIYRNEGHHRDVLTFEAAAVDFNKYGFDLVYRVSRKADGKEIGRGKNGIVFVEPVSRKVSTIPAEFLRRLGGPTT